MNKSLYIRVLDHLVTCGGSATHDSINLENKITDVNPVLLEPNEYPLLYKDHLITDEEFENAIDIIITHLMQRELHTIMVDLGIKSKLEEEKRKPLEITIQELSDMFGGRKVVIVDHKKDEDQVEQEDKPGHGK